MSGLRIAIPGELEAGHVARRAISASQPTLPQSVQDDVSLLVTELIGNAVQHGDAGTDRSVDVEVLRRGGHIRVEVTNTGADFDPPSSPMPGDSSGGWGLFLVDRIAESWGVSRAAAGTCVWFELPAGAPLGEVPHRVQ